MLLFSENLLIGSCVFFWVFLRQVTTHLSFQCTFHCSSLYSPFLSLFSEYWSFYMIYGHNDQKSSVFKVKLYCWLVSLHCTTAISSLLFSAVCCCCCWFLNSYSCLFQFVPSLCSTVKLQLIVQSILSKNVTLYLWTGKFFFHKLSALDTWKS